MSKPYELYLGLSELNITNSEVVLELPILKGLAIEPNKIFYVVTNEAGELEYKAIDRLESYKVNVKGEQGPPGGSLSRKTILLGAAPYNGTDIEAVGYKPLKEYYIKDIMNSIEGFTAERYPGGLRIVTYQDTVFRLIFPQLEETSVFKNVNIEVLQFVGSARIVGEVNAPLLYYDATYLIDDPLISPTGYPLTDTNGENRTNYIGENHLVLSKEFASIKLVQTEVGWLITCPKEYLVEPASVLNNPEYLYQEV